MSGKGKNVTLDAYLHGFLSQKQYQNIIVFQTNLMMYYPHWEAPYSPGQILHGEYFRYGW